MKRQNTSPKNWISFRLKPEEYNIIHTFFVKTTFQKLSEYCRSVLLQKPVHILYRNQSADNFLAEAMLLKKELNAIGHNLNQAVKKLHTLDQLTEVKQWLLQQQPLNEIIIKKTEEICNRMHEIYTIWSSE